MKILSVDDSAIIRKVVKAGVEVLNFEFLEASDGYEALSVLLKYSDVKLILLDWNMPGISGLELLKRLKSNEAYKDIPVMMVTTESEQENIIKAIQAGASHYLTKPFNIEDLMKRILECLGEGGN